MPNPPSSPHLRDDLAEVWGETISLRNLGLSLLISLPLSLGVFLGARALLRTHLANPAQAETYSLIIGLLAVVCSAVLCALLFQPQRILITHGEESSTAAEEAIEELIQDGHLGRVEDLPDDIRAELQEAGLEEAFRRAERRGASGEHSA